MVKPDARKRALVLNACCDRLAAVKCAVGKHRPLHVRIAEGARRRAGGAWCPEEWGFMAHRTTMLPNGSTRTVVRSKFTEDMSDEPPRFVSTFTSDTDGVLRSVELCVYARCAGMRLLLGDDAMAKAGLTITPGCIHISRSCTTHGRSLDALIAPLGASAVRGVGAAVLPKGIEAARSALEGVFGETRRGCSVELLLRALSLVSQTGVMLEDGRVIRQDPRPRIAAASSRKLLAAVHAKGVYWKWREHTARRRYHPDRMRAEIEAQCAAL